MPRNDTIDTIKIGIQYVSTGKDTAKELDKISNALVKLQARVEIVDLSKCIRQLNKLNKVDLSNITSQVNELVDSLKQLKAFKNFTMNIKNAKTVNKILDDLTESQEKWKDVTINVGGNKQPLALGYSQLFTDYLPNYTRFNQMGQEYGLIFSNQFKQSFDSVSEYIDTTFMWNFGNTRGSFFGRLFGNAFSNSFINRFGSSVIRIALYRLIRRVIQIITNAIKEGIQNVAIFDDSFNDTMTELKSTFTYFKNAFATTITPLIQALEPLITNILKLLVEALNVASETSALFNGQDTFTKAKYYADDYAKSLLKIKSILVSFDEINTIGNSGSNAMFQFEEAKISETTKSLASGFKVIGDVFKNLINIFESEQWGGIVDLFIGVLEVLNTFNNIPTDIIFGVVIEILDSLFEILNMFSPTGILSGIFGEDFGAKFKEWVKTFSDFVNKIKDFIVSDVLGSVLKVIVGFYEAIQGLFTGSTWVKLKKLLESLGIKFDEGDKDPSSNVSNENYYNGGLVGGTSGKAFGGGFSSGFSTISGGGVFSNLARYDLDSVAMLGQISNFPTPQDIVTPQELASSESNMVDTIAKAIDKNSSSGDIYIQLIDENGNVKNEQIVGSINKKNRREGKQVIPVLVN